MRALKHTLLMASIVFSAMMGIQAEAGTIAEEEVKSAIIEYLAASCTIPGMEIEFSVPRVAQISVPGCDHPKVAISHDQIELPLRSVPVTVTITDENGEVIRNLRQVVRLRFFTDAVVAATDIGLGEKLKPEHLTVKRVDVTGVKEYYTSLECLDGLQTKKYLRSGTVLSEDTVRPVFLVDRGDKVAVEIRDGTFTIRAEGTARQGGSLGEKISVYIDMTKTTVSGIVINEKTVLTGAIGG